MAISEKLSDPNAPWTAVVGVIGAILTFAIVVALQVIFLRVDEQQKNEKVYGVASEELIRIRSQQLENLNSYQWVDEQSGVVSIPIDRAMDLIVTEQANRASSTGTARTE